MRRSGIGGRDTLRIDAMAMAALHLPGMPWSAFLALTPPGVGVAAACILGKGVKEDYRCYVQDALWDKGWPAGENGATAVRG